jgi:hypothetical protein
MSCHQLWDTKFLFGTHSKACLKRIKESQKDRLFNVEMSLLPETQEYVKYYKEIPQLKENQKEMTRHVEFHRTQMVNYRGVVNELNRSFHKKEMYSSMYEHLVKKDRIDKISDIIHGRSNQIDMLNQPNNYQPKPKKIQYIKKCEKEECNGFINKSNYQCGICDTKICKDCLNVTNDEHHCKDEDVQTAQLMLKDSKPCPECGVPIHKIDGCNHMFCTQCNTPFDWRTMEIQKQGNTNPHYYHWLNFSGERHTNREHGCGENITIGDLSHRPIFRSLNTQIKEKVLRTLQVFHHMDIFQIQSPMSVEDLSNRNRFLRIKYLCNEVSSKMMKVQLMKTYKMNEFAIHKTQVVQLVRDIRIDFIARMYRCDNVEALHTHCEELHGFRNYILKSYANLESVYGLKCRMES